jgi:phosphohistidine phosphatase
MTKTLILMRHAKSSWNDPTQSDHDRPLNARGQAAATVLGDWLRDADWTPDQALVSDSERTRETFERLKLSLAAEFTGALYHANPTDMQLVLEMATGDTVLMIGHNPGISEFAEVMARTPPAHRKFHDFPTGATLILRFDIDTWDQVDKGLGEVLDFITPRELTDKTDG